VGRVLFDLDVVGPQWCHLADLYAGSIQTYEDYCVYQERLRLGRGDCSMDEFFSISQCEGKMAYKQLKAARNFRRLWRSKW
jgi:hypothetical protein